MSQRKASSSRLLSIALIFISAAVIIGMMFLPAVEHTEVNGETTTTTSYTGMQLAFGYELNKADGGAIYNMTTTIASSIYMILAYLLPVAGFILVLLGSFSKNKNVQVVIGFVVDKIFIFTGLMLFLVTYFSGLQIHSVSTILGIDTITYTTFENLKYQLSIPTYVAFAFSCLGLVSCLIYETAE